GFLRLLDGQGAAPAQDIGHEAPVTRIEVLHDDDRGRKVVRERRQDLTQCFEAARGGRDGDDFEGRALRRGQARYFPLGGNPCNLQGFRPASGGGRAAAAGARTIAWLLARGHEWRVRRVPETRRRDASDGIGPEDASGVRVPRRRPLGAYRVNERLPLAYADGGQESLGDGTVVQDARDLVLIAELAGLAHPAMERALRHLDEAR